MDKLTTYFIDENIVPVLFGENDTLKIQEISDKIDTEVMKNFKETVIQHLITKGLSQEQAENIAESDWETLTPELQVYVQDVELLTKINSSTELVYKGYFTELFPKLSPEDQDWLIKYINNIATASQVITENRDEIEKTINELMQKYNVTTKEELIEKVKADKSLLGTNSDTNNAVMNQVLQGLQNANQNNVSPMLKKILDERINDLSQEK